MASNLKCCRLSLTRQLNMPYVMLLAQLALLVKPTNADRLNTDLTTFSTAVTNPQFYPPTTSSEV
jgi:hypothetical protein